MSNCAPNRLSTGLGIPEDINAGLAPYTGNVSMQAMQSCCAPNEVHRSGLSNCTMWCELSDAFMQDVGEEGSGENPLSSVLMACLRERAPENTTLITGGQYASAATGRISGPGVKGAVVILGVLAATWAVV